MGVLGYEPAGETIGEADAGASPNGRGVPRRGIVVREIDPTGSAEGSGLRPGDLLLSVNGEPIHDAIDLLFHGSESRLDVRYRRGEERRLRRVEIEREPGRELGIVLEDFRIRLCNNQCVFCFIHQNPPGLRKGIYFRDGDFRMSFLHGNYITMTNMREADFDRVIDQRLSPMYVSVHSTNHPLRLKMLGVKRSSNVLDDLRRLARGGIEFHTQIVLCPGLNDGAELERTARDLARFRRALKSIAIVPLGMTEHRKGLAELQPTTPSFCKRTIDRVAPLQAKLAERFGDPILFLADEFYVMAGRPTPNYRDVPVLHQLENGVGMVWEFLAPWRSVARRLPSRIRPSRSVALLTGLLGARVLKKVSTRLSAVAGLNVDVIPCANRLFGRSVTVSGLLSGGDFLRAIAENPGYDRYLIPGNAVRAEGEVFLDDISLDELKRRTGGRVQAIDGDCSDLVDAILNDDAPAGERHDR